MEDVGHVRTLDYRRDSEWPNFFAEGDGFKRTFPANADGVEDAADFRGWIGADGGAGQDGSRLDADDFGVHLAGVFPFAPRNFREHGVASGINVCGFEAGAGVRDVLGHGFFGPRRISGADEDGESEAECAGWCGVRG